MLAGVVAVWAPIEANAQTIAAIDLPDLAQRLERARDATRRYAQQLRIGLHEALKSGGPKAAVGACVSLGPDLDAQVSEQTGIEIGRTALRVRNPENTPDAWEQAGLATMAKRLAAGVDPARLEIYEVTVSSEGQRLFRYLQPIMMREGCLACHGPNVSADVKAEIARSYPDDKAIGFIVGELRGAFTLVQLID
jgi:hypothetical protein